MFHLLDTETCSCAIRGEVAALDTKLAKAKPETLAIAAVTRAELLFGLEKRGKPKPLTRLVLSFLQRIPALPWDTAAADRFAKLLATLERAGTPIGLMNAMIAAQALALDASLVTNNDQHGVESVTPLCGLSTDEMYGLVARSDNNRKAATLHDRLHRDQRNMAEVM